MHNFHFSTQHMYPNRHKLSWRLNIVVQTWIQHFLQDICYWNFPYNVAFLVCLVYIGWMIFTRHPPANTSMLFIPPLLSFYFLCSELQLLSLLGDIFTFPLHPHWIYVTSHSKILLHFLLFPSAVWYRTRSIKTISLTGMFQVI